MSLRPKIAARFGVMLLLCCPFSAAPLGAAIAAKPAQFPALDAATLDKARLHLPADFSGEQNLVILSFAREQQSDVDSWFAVARQVKAAHPRFRCYELAATSRNNVVYRWWFDAALRSNTAEPSMRGRVLTAYVSLGRLQRSLDIRDDRHVVALLVDRMGKIGWRAEGAATAGSEQALESALAAAGMDLRRN